jgi:hypothetical protein
MPNKVKATKTLNPLHFEDLEPHRFEDLVRRLLYAFRDWSELEPTGRSGSDEGFDIRAWEKADSVTNVSEEGEQGVHSVGRKLWQVQGKREKSIAPTRMRTIIREGVDKSTPPYGYLLAVAANISKKTYDVFRDELRKKGVTEFYFWGKDHLEDQLALPENDEILFTFFGISLSPRRRTRTAEIKFSINNKNKMLKMLFDREDLIDQGIRHTKRMLLRDIKDRHYPDKGQYADFDKHQRWEEHGAVQVDATGVLFEVREWYAYLNAKTKEWDFTRAVDLIHRSHDLDELNQRRKQDYGKKVEHYWRHLPRHLQAKLVVYGYINYEDMLIIDEKGDPEFAMPHLFIDFDEKQEPFAYPFANLLHGYQERIHSGELQSAYKKINVFLDPFPEPKKGTIHELDKLGLTGTPLMRLRNPRGAGILYSFDRKLAFLSEGDLIHVPKTEERGVDRHVEVTHVSKTTVAAYIKEQGSGHFLREMEEYAGRKVTKKDQVTIYEIFEVYTWGKYLTYADHS